MGRPARLVAVTLAGTAVTALMGWRAEGADGTASPGAALSRMVDEAPPAKKPFRALTAAKLSVGDREMDVVIADDADERSAGLRQRRDVGPYDGMLFAFGEATTTAFTMSTVPVALDIGFYDARGRVVDRLRMDPCAGRESDCPLYRASGPFRYALETAAGELPRGRLAA